MAVQHRVRAPTAIATPQLPERQPSPLHINGLSAAAALQPQVLQPPMYLLHDELKQIQDACNTIAHVVQVAVQHAEAFGEYLRMARPINLVPSALLVFVGAWVRMNDEPMVAPHDVVQDYHAGTPCSDAAGRDWSLCAAAWQWPGVAGLPYVSRRRSSVMHCERLF